VKASAFQGDGDGFGEASFFAGFALRRLGRPIHQLKGAEA
jgi:hypothetical protein